MDWNTKVLFIWVSAECNNSEFTLWDLRIPRESFDLYSHKWKTAIEYPIEYRAALDKMCTLYFNWEHMPLVGFNYKV
jgi:hypothetical protein